MERRTKIVLPEVSVDSRIEAAGKHISSVGLAEIVSFETDSSDSDVRVASGVVTEQHVEFMKTLPRYQNESRESLQALLEEKPLYFGALLVRSGEADGMVAGAHFTTPEVIRSGIHVIGLSDEIKTASSSFLMKFPDGRELVYADCGVVIEPSAEQLADIAISSAETARSFGIEPRVALLSHSTHGSSRHSKAEQVQRACKILRDRNVNFAFDGEVQVDVALVPEVATQKTTSIFEEGPATVMIFPDIDSGNIAYKLSERLAGATALGPLLQGFEYPINDLSRGCSIEDIIEVSKITINQARNP